MSGEPRLTTHVLDTARGRPASGVAVSVARRSGPTLEPLAATTTNADGRTDEPLLSGVAWTRGTYELTFAIGDYFADQPGGPARSEPASFLDEVPVRFSVDGTEHVHVALLVTPWSYTTYRGS